MSKLFFLNKHTVRKIEENLILRSSPLWDFDLEQYLLLLSKRKKCFYNFFILQMKEISVSAGNQ